MTTWSDELSFKLWACKSIMAMIRIQQHSPDPHQVMQDYFDEAGEGDEEQLVWAMAMWKTISHMTSFELEESMARAKERYEVLLDGGHMASS